jgi:hypothetical protein
MKLYNADILKVLEKALHEAPVLKPRFYTQEEVLLRLRSQIREMYQKKNYDPKQIVEMLKAEGFRVTQRDIKGVLSDILRPTRRAKNEICKA